MLVRFIVLHATFNNISVTSWWSVLSVEETGVPGENHRPATSHWQTLSHDVVLSTPRLSCIWTRNVSGDRHWIQFVELSLALFMSGKSFKYSEVLDRLSNTMCDSSLRHEGGSNSQL